MTKFWDGRTDGVTALLDLLTPLETQVITINFMKKSRGRGTVGFRAGPLSGKSGVRILDACHGHRYSPSKFEKKF